VEDIGEAVIGAKIGAIPECCPPADTDTMVAAVPYHRIEQRLVVVLHRAAVRRCAKVMRNDVARDSRDERRHPGNNICDQVHESAPTGGVNSAKTFTASACPERVSL
jgi:hypothetical protein